MVESNIEKEGFLAQHTDFSLREQVLYPNGGKSCFYDNGIDMIIIDDDICNHEKKEPVFSYMLITDKQNNYIHQFRRVFRFLDMNERRLTDIFIMLRLRYPLIIQ